MHLLIWHTRCNKKYIPTTAIKQTMNAIIKAAKTMFNALAFANADNYSEFRALLRQVDRPAASDGALARHKLVSVASGSAAIAPAIPHIQRAL
jgi:hypothetical protein